jgi:hypothetical protein
VSLACPTCSAPFIEHNGLIQTLVGYNSPPGHDHDDNCLGATYTCANGHETSLAFQRRCSTPGCDWKGKDECFCHPGKKVDARPPAGVPRRGP